MRMRKFRKIFSLIFITLLIFSCASDSTIEFAWLSDTHVGVTTGAADLSLAVRDINSMKTLDFVIVSGDITETGKSADLELAKAILDSLNIPYHIIPGNHDTKWSESGATKFPELWGSDKFNFEFRGMRFIGMHQGPIMRMADGHFSPEDLRWLDSQLAELKNKNQPLIFITHYPIDSSVDNWYEFFDRVKKYNTVAVLFGHGHRNNSYDLEGIAGVMGRSSLRRNEKRGGFNIVRIDSDSLRIAERITGAETLPVWHSLPLRPVSFEEDTTRFERPDFSVNQQYPHVKTEWLFDTKFTIASTPAVADGIVIIGNSDGTVHGLSLEDGSERWRFHAGNSVYSTPATSDGKVVFGSTDNFIYCLNAKSGDLIWKFKTEAPVVAAPVIELERVFIGGSDGKFRAIDLTTGVLIWEFSGIQEFVETKPLVYCNQVIFGAWDTFLYALKISDGSLAWKWSNKNSWKLVSPAACWPVAADDKIFIVAPDRYMTAIDAESGETVWRTNRYKVRESIGISEDGKTVFARCMEDTVVAFSTLSEEPKLRWTSHCGYGYDIDPCMPVEKDGLLFFGTKNGFVFALDSKTGDVKWQHRVGVALVNTVVPLDGHRVLLTDMDGRVMMLADDRK